MANDSFMRSAINPMPVVNRSSAINAHAAKRWYAIPLGILTLVSNGPLVCDTDRSLANCRRSAHTLTIASTAPTRTSNHTNAKKSPTSFMAAVFFSRSSHHTPAANTISKAAIHIDPRRPSRQAITRFRAPIAAIATTTHQEAIALYSHSANPTVIMPNVRAGHAAQEEFARSGGAVWNNRRFTAQVPTGNSHAARHAPAINAWNACP